MYETILYNVDQGVATITLNRPDSLNAFTKQLNDDVRKAVKQASGDSDVRCIVITGAGRAFCSGQDLKDVGESADFGEVLRNNYHPMVREIERCEKPVIAAVNGVAAGAGFSLALACDFRIASEKSSFIQAFIHIGLVPDAANLYYLPKLIGEAKAMELAVLGDKISAETAQEYGLLTKLVSSDNWEDEVNGFAGRLAAMPTKAIGLIKRSIKASWNTTFDEYLEKEAYGQRIAGLTDDFEEGVQAFIDKRKPAFQGK
ncbi:enoyl-CoA hydratase-related protein [Pontibacillus sp. HMF3514]|uniref:enoyl-CoA hydratase-related protein n=1 Tax=Pontibacillus sp. HMF3514 TaxID=2692425 RepID=UPI00131FE0F1|nr:enoyl-CoA hydratase-related protein [Pontibacillus sp. HMF3514]QHE52738.1 2-(1,2-epoxy-1,2-dihydrophenyl)acetyl-CoA isomerase [Pontibacillus sp. HMF3514]